MECDLDEVSGQMALPLPTHTSARSPEPNFRFPALTRLLNVFPVLVSEDLLTILNAAYQWSASGPGWPPLRGGDHGARHGSSSRRSKAR